MGSEDTEYNFHVGDRVYLTVNNPDGNDHLLIGSTGTVCRIDRTRLQSFSLGTRGEMIGVRWDNDVRGHNCDGTCDDGHGWNVWADQLKPEVNDIPDEDIACLDDITSFLMYKSI